jgi:hypothetical protein
MTQALLDRLAHLAARNPQARPLYNAETHGSETSREDLEYEDWAQVMKLSGGDIAVYWECEKHGLAGFVRYGPAGLSFAHGRDWTETGPAAVDAFRRVVCNSQFQVEPIQARELPADEETHD